MDGRNGLAKERSMTRNQNHVDGAYKFQSCDNVGMAPWSDINHDVLLLVMMRLEFLDFSAFSKVCKSWRSVALCNRKRFLVSRPPMSIWISFDANEEEGYLKDFEVKKLKAIIPNSARKDCVGSTSGYLILFGKETNDFWLVNPITRHPFHFSAFPGSTNYYYVRAIIIFSPSINGWVFVMTNRYDHHIWFSVAGKGTWNHVLSNSPIYDLLAFKGKIYTLNKGLRLCELRFDPVPKMTLLEIKNFQEPDFWLCEFASSGENLYVIYFTSLNSYEVHELDFGKTEWVVPEEKTIGEYVFFHSILNHGVAIKRESWVVDPRLHYTSYGMLPNTIDISRKGRLFFTNMWYFPHLSLDVDHINE